MSRHWDYTPKTTPRQLRPYIGQIVPLSDIDRQFFFDVYGLTAAMIRGRIMVDPGTDRYVLPIYSPTGRIRGHVLRQPWSKSPRSPPTWYGSAKADTYMNVAEPVQSFYTRLVTWDGNPDPLVMVEDQLSAIKLAAYGFSSVAVLGTPYTKDPLGYQQADRVAELAREAASREFIVALDADATADALLFAKKWGAAFKKIRVAILEQDLKDTPSTEFGRVLGV